MLTSTEMGTLENEVIAAAKAWYRGGERIDRSIVRLSRAVGRLLRAERVAAADTRRRKSREMRLVLDHSMKAKADG